jgi:hypothetical protein
LDYLIQYPVKSVNVKKDKPGYEIEFEGHNDTQGAIVGIEEKPTKENPMPKDIVGKALIMTVQSTSVTRLVFGTVVKNPNGEGNIVQGQEEVSVSPSGYYIVDPRFGSDPFWPGKMPDVPPDAPHVAPLVLGGAGEFTDGPSQDENKTDEDA